MKTLTIWIMFISAALFAQNQQIYTVCEGNFGSSNASLWSFDDSFTGISGPIYWDANTNPLGDIAQSIFIGDDQKLYIVVNNSHTIEVMDLASGTPVFDRTISLTNASPRYMEIYNGSAYVTCWNLNGILVIDLATDTFTDTIAVAGMPEDIVIIGDKIYVSLTMDAAWSSNNIVNEIDLGNQNIITKSYTVIPGPNRLLPFNDFLYVSSTYYDDSWNSYYGTSRINLSDDSVETRDYGVSFAYGNDMVALSGQVYKIYDNGIAPLTDSLTIDTTRQIGNITGIYTLASDGRYFYIGATDYVAPDDVFVLDTTGTLVAQFQVGAIPGDFAFYQTGSVNIIDENTPLASGYKLISNYPNPFNPTTTIQVNITEADMTAISIFNIRGQQVASLWNDNLSTGEHLFQWDAANQPSGIYFAVIKQGQNTAVRKMHLIK